MLNPTIGQRVLGAVGAGIVSLVLLAGCDSGDTDGGSATPGQGPSFVSDGGAGATLTIEAPRTIDVGDRQPFRVTALDPNGQPLSFIRIFCETESGIAILEPSRGGVAFEHTGAAGVMSGVLGGVTPGSYLLECRGPQGFNLLARMSILITGEVPEGFTGFPGAAGGNLGGGLLVDPPEEDIQVAEVTFVDVTGNESRNGPIDINFNPDCNNDGILTDPEPYGFDDYLIRFQNALEQRVFVETITFTVFDGRNVTSTQQFGGLLVPAGTETVIEGSFTEFVFGTSTKTYAGTAFALIPGTYNVTFTITGETDGGEGFVLEQSASITIGAVDNC